MQYLPAWLSGTLLLGTARTLRLLCAFALALSVPEAAWAQPSKDELARTHFESGAAYLQQSDLESALREFESAYRLSPRPEILLNIATVHERMGDLPAAVAALEQYLAGAPGGEHAGTVQVRIENLQKRIAEGSQQQEAAAKADEHASAPASQPPQAEPQPESGPAAPEPEPATPVASVPQTPSRLPAYLVLGGAGLAAAGAAVTGLLATSEYEDLERTCKPSCTDSQVSTSKNLALTSTLLTAVAVVAAGVGAALLWTTADSESPPESGAVPRVVVGFDAVSAEASASWRF